MFRGAGRHKVVRLWTELRDKTGKEGNESGVIIPGSRDEWGRTEDLNIADKLTYIAAVRRLSSCLIRSEKREMNRFVRAAKMLRKETMKTIAKKPI